LSTYWNQSIFEFGLQKLCSFNSKWSLFSKKRLKNQKLQVPSGSKKKIGKKFFHDVLRSIRRINVQKISQIGDDHWSFDRFLQKSALKDFSVVKFCDRNKSLVLYAIEAKCSSLNFIMSIKMFSLVIRRNAVSGF
jgi:hypothetical protein